MKWISIKEKLPEKPTQCWVINLKKYPWHPILASYDGESFTFGPQNYLLPSTICLEITHWIKMPDPPEEWK